MATIWKEVVVDVALEEAWDAVRDFANVHPRVFSKVLTATRLEPGARVVTFADGREVREPLVTLDEERRRVVWTTTGGLSHHNASLQVVAEPDGRSRIVWITDILPDAAAPMIRAVIEQGAADMKATLERLKDA